MESHDIDRFKNIYGLEDWEIVVRENRKGNKHCGDVNLRERYRQATITLYRKAITETNKTFRETADSVIHHECGEIVVWSLADGRVPKDVKAEPWFEELMDVIADYIGKLGERLDGMGG